MEKIIIVLCLLVSTASWATVERDKGVRLVNQKKYKEAALILEKESAKGDANATFWWAVAQYRGGEHFKAGSTFRKAAEMGDPWAMAGLTEDNAYSLSPCGYLGWGCDDEWEDKAQQGWEKLAESGNAEAFYAAYGRGNQWWELIPFYNEKRYRELRLNAIPHLGLDMVFDGRFWETEADQVKYVEMFAEQGDGAAMLWMYGYLIDEGRAEEAIQWAEKSVQAGYPEAAKILRGLYMGDSEGIVDYKKSYYYDSLYMAMGGAISYANLIVSKRLKTEDGGLILDENGVSVKEIFVTEKEQAEMDEQVNAFMKTIKINLFLNENSDSLFDLSY